jgi:DivIVA domain-containing protein
MSTEEEQRAAEGPAEPQAEQGDGVPELRTRVPAEIRNVSFPTSVRGYDRNTVDAYVLRVNRVIAELEISRSPQAAVRHAVERVTEQTKHILEEARDSAEKIIATAQEEADQILAGAKAEAADLVVNASSEADRLGVEAQQTLENARREADGIVAGAREEAEQILARARAEATETRRRTETDVAALREQAEARLRELQSDTDAVWTQRRALLGDIEGIATLLRDAATEAGTRFSSAKPAEEASSETATAGEKPPTGP